jgi:cystathionine gamma-synthase
VFGFPYLDTLKLMQRTEFNPAGVHFFGKGDEADLSSFESLLASKQRIAAVFTEFPSNPLLRSHDLKRLAKLARQHDFLIIVDDTISSFANIDLLPYADIVVSSLTKIFSGRGDVMGGSMVISPQGRSAGLLRAALPSMHIPDLFYLDAITLERNSRDFVARTFRINNTALRFLYNTLYLS